MRQGKDVKNQKGQLNMKKIKDIMMEMENAKDIKVTNSKFPEDFEKTFIAKIHSNNNIGLFRNGTMFAQGKVVGYNATNHKVVLRTPVGGTIELIYEPTTTAINETEVYNNNIESERRFLKVTNKKNKISFISLNNITNYDAAEIDTVEEEGGKVKKFILKDYIIHYLVGFAEYRYDNAMNYKVRESLIKEFINKRTHTKDEADFVVWYLTNEIYKEGR